MMATVLPNKRFIRSVRVYVPRNYNGMALLLSPSAIMPPWKSSIPCSILHIPPTRMQPTITIPPGIKIILKDEDYYRLKVERVALPVSYAEIRQVIIPEF